MQMAVLVAGSPSGVGTAGQEAGWPAALSVSWKLPMLFAAAGRCPCRSEMEKLEPSPFKAAFVERSRLSSLLSKYYGNSYIGAISPHTGRWAEGAGCLAAHAQTLQPHAKPTSTAGLMHRWT